MEKSTLASNYTSNKELILVTAALPYANNDLHIGHMLEHTQADIWVRFLRLIGRNVAFVCGDDAHGTPIMLRAQLLEQDPKELVDACHQNNQEIFSKFNISFDIYSSTATDAHATNVQNLYRKLKKHGYIITRDIEQYYDPVKQMFLPDRYIKGTCPKCGAADQYGDNCEVCSATYAPTDLLDPRSVLSGATPELKTTEHLFFDLPKLTKVLQDWHDTGSIQKEVANKMEEWFDQGLQLWDISRDKPYFGVPVPNDPDKYFYVWLDAPIGYLSFFKEYCKEHNLDYQRLISNKNKDLKMYHFIGKDIVYFHSLFWPAMLHGVDYKLPTNIFTHGYVTVNGVKMSKSRGTFIKAKTFAQYFPSDALRYYYASKLNASIADVDLNLEDFVTKINSDLVNKYVNLASRSVKFINKYFDNKLSSDLDEPLAYQLFTTKFEEIEQGYMSLNYSRVVRNISALAAEANRYFDEKAPWLMAKDPTRMKELHRVCTQTIMYFRALSILLKPITPELVARAEDFLNETLTWNSLNDLPYEGQKINDFSNLFTRLDVKQIVALTEQSKAEAVAEMAFNATLQDKVAANTATNTSITTVGNTITQTVTKELISIDDFAKLDLRVATILACNHVKGSTKLLQFTLDLGNGETRNVFSGIKASYTDPVELVGMQVILVANLAPRKMRFGVSEGMILSAKDDQGLTLIVASKPVASGSEVA